MSFPLDSQTISALVP